MRISLLTILAILFIGCGQHTSYQRDPKWVLADEIYDNEIGKKVFSTLKKEKNLRVCESGWDLRGKDKIQVMHCGFHYYAEVNLEKARELLLSAGSLYLNTINENKRIAPFLATHPFKLENIKLDIFFKKLDGSQLPLEKIHVISITNGVLEYKICDPQTKLFITLCKETYHEAVEKLSTTNNIPENDLIF